jgi:pimeloyl-ACP methyl ester carboxylesterase
MDLPIGYRKFHKQKFINYQMNRLHSLGHSKQADIEEAAKEINNSVDYVREFKKLAEVAKRDGRLQNAAFYLRAAEFFTAIDSEERLDTYQEFLDVFYTSFADENISRHAVAYQGSVLPAMELNPTGKKGTILLFGGFDSLIEEFFVIWKYFATAGYRVIAFEGPGQGGALQLHGLHFDHDWEKPVGAVLNHFAIEKASLIGISMGGYWAVRAAAYEKRIHQVVAWPPVYDWMEQIPGFLQSMVTPLLKLEGFMNGNIRLRMRLAPILDHAIKQAMFMVGKEQPMDAVRWLLGMNKLHISSEKVTQDVLLLGGENDAFQPIKLLKKQRDALTQARSVKSRIFTKAENADMHCQMGNLNLALSEIEKWLSSVKEDRQ